jgi:hypothetical protein
VAIFKGYYRILSNQNSSNEKLFDWLYPIKMNLNSTMSITCKSGEEEFSLTRREDGLYICDGIGFKINSVSETSC